MDPFGAVCVLAVVLFAAVLALAIVVGVRTRRRERTRQQALQMWAMANRWAYTPAPAVDWGSRLPGRNQRGVSLALSGPLWGRPVSIAEYSYTVHTSSTGADGNPTSSSETHHYVVTVIRLDRPWPALGVLPRSGLSKLGRAMFQPGSAAGREEFDRRFSVTGDPAAIPPALIAAHVAGQAPVWSIAGVELMSWQPGRIGDPERLADLAAPLYAVADLLIGPATLTGSDAAGRPR